MVEHQRFVAAQAVVSRRGVLARGWTLAGAIALAPDSACSSPSQATAEADDDDALLARLLAGARPLIPRRAQPYRITRTLLIAPGRTVVIEAGTRILWAGSLGTPGEPVAVFEAMGDGTVLAVSGDGVAEVRSERPSIMVYAAMMRGGHRGFTVAGIQAVNCHHVHAASSAASKGHAAVRTGPDGNVARDVRVRGGGAKFDSLPNESGNSACMLLFVEGAHVADVHYENVCGGVQWWGGDSGLAPWQDGARANERKCSDILVERATVRTVRNSAVWGSMGRDVRVRDCSFDECYDVGFNAEGCDNVIFERCTARNGHNGCFTTFAFCSNIRFVDCRGTVNKKAYPLVRVYNSSQSNADNRDLVVQGGRFECLDPTGPATIDAAFGPVREITVTGATMINVAINTAYSLMHHTRIMNNDLTFPYPIGGASAIKAGTTVAAPGEAGTVVIENNRIRYTAASKQEAGAAIELVENDPFAAAVDRISGNSVTGPFAAGIIIASLAPSGKAAPVFTVRANRFDALAPYAPLLLQQRSPAVAPIIHWEGQSRDNRPVSLRAALGAG